MEVGVVQDPLPFGPHRRFFVLQDAPSPKSNQGGRLTSLWHTLRGMGSPKASGPNQGWKSIFMGWRVVLFHSCMCVVVRRHLLQLMRPRAQYMACLHSYSGQLKPGGQRPID